MPYVSVRLIEGPTSQQKERVISGITQVMVEVLDKNPETTFVVIDEVSADNWGLGGMSVTTRRRRGVSVPLPARAPCAAVALRSLVEPERRDGLDQGGMLAFGRDPFEVAFQYENVDGAIFERAPRAGLDRWRPLLPPLREGVTAGEGATPLVRSERLAAWANAEEVWLKLESQNPTGSHKDRFNVVAIGAAVARGARGVALATMGNHGISAASYAARCGLPCVVLLGDSAPRELRAQLRDFGAAVLLVPWDQRFAALQTVCRDFNYSPLSSTDEQYINGDPYGPEGYKSIAYEVCSQLGSRQLSRLFVPSGHSELLFGVHKGLSELKHFGRLAQLPQLIACEPEARGPLRTAVDTGSAIARVEARPTAATSIGVCVSSMRGMLTIRASGGRVVVVSDEELRAARRELLAEGVLAELSACAGLAALRKEGLRTHTPGCSVCIVTGSGLRTSSTDAGDVPRLSEASPLAVRRALAEHYGLHP